MGVLFGQLGNLCVFLLKTDQQSVVVRMYLLELFRLITQRVQRLLLLCLCGRYLGLPVRHLFGLPVQHLLQSL
ncbi:hypothetical protein D3C75_1189800 [compost metagenome]